MSIRISPQASKVLASEIRSTASDATVIRMHIKKSYIRIKSSFYTKSSSNSSNSSNSSKVAPPRWLHENEESVIINMIYDAGGAKAPSLVFEDMEEGP